MRRQKLQKMKITGKLKAKVKQRRMEKQYLNRFIKCTGIYIQEI